MIAALILTLCTTGIAPSCADYDTGMACLGGIQPQIAAIEWLRDHPEYETLALRGYRCEPGEAL